MIRATVWTSAALLAAAMMIAALEARSVPSASVAAQEGNLHDVMMDRLNPAFTKIAYALHHDRETPEEKRWEIVAENIEVIILESGRIPSYRPPRHGDRVHDYEEYAVLSRRSAVSLREAALEGDAAEMKLWFSHLKNACMSCHRTYRFGEDAPIRTR